MNSYFFINHTKLHIVKAGNDAKTNIGINLFNSIRNNQWSIGDHIEFVDLLHCETIKLKDLIQNNNYYCTINDYNCFNY